MPLQGHQGGITLHFHAELAGGKRSNDEVEQGTRPCGRFYQNVLAESRTQQCNVVHFRQHALLKKQIEIQCISTDVLE
jgi:hypothetical protein